MKVKVITGVSSTEELKKVVNELIKIEEEHNPHCTLQVEITLYDQED